MTVLDGFYFGLGLACAYAVYAVVGALTSVTVAAFGLYWPRRRR